MALKVYCSNVSTPHVLPVKWNGENHRFLLAANSITDAQFVYALCVVAESVEAAHKVVQEWHRICAEFHKLAKSLGHEKCCKKSDPDYAATCGKHPRATEQLYKLRRDAERLICMGPIAKTPVDQKDDEV